MTLYSTMRRRSRHMYDYDYYCNYANTHDDRSTANNKSDNSNANYYCHSYY